jgi:hypothetical protein
MEQATELFPDQLLKDRCGQPVWASAWAQKIGLAQDHLPKAQTAEDELIEVFK